MKIRNFAKETKNLINTMYKSTLIGVLFSLTLIFSSCGFPTRNLDNESREEHETEHPEQEFHNQTSIASSVTVQMIATDLIGRRISDPETHGYHDSNWSLIIEEGEINDLQVIEVLENTDNIYKCLVTLNLRWQPNYYFATKLKLLYQRSPRQGWELDMVTPISLILHSDDTYRDCISTVVYSDLYGVHTYLRNNCDVPLKVYHRDNVSGRMEKNITVVPGNSEVKANVWQINECIIEHVLRDR